MNWRPLRGVDLRRLRQARLQAHHALQWLARAGRGYIPAQPDDSHTSLQWDGDTDNFVTHMFGRGLRLHLQLTTLTLGLRAGEGPPDVQYFPLQRCTDSQVRQWLGEKLAVQNLDPSVLDAPAPYEIPPRAVGEGAAYDPAGSADALAELAAWYGNAAALLAHVRQQMNARSLAPSPLCCWPHHFDLATSTAGATRRGDSSGSIGAGLSPGDEYYDEPYFYVSAYPDPDPAALPTLPAPGRWHTREFTAAVATASNILAANNQAEATDAFLQKAAEIAIKMVADAP